MMIGLPPAVLFLLERLWRGGYRAYAVGGCVRDSLMGRTPQDWDIATDALPHQTARCFQGLTVVETGIRHGTVTAVVDHICYEVTTFRRDGTYTDHRRPDSVVFVDSLGEDLARRDFTINAMAYHPREGLVDRFGGASDIRRRRISCVGDASTRFGEDALRILRGIRFASTLDFQVEGDTARAMEVCAPLLSNVAPERLRVELDKTLAGPAAAGCLKEHSAVMAQLLPELSPDAWERGIRVLEHTPPSIPMALAALLHGDESMACAVLDRLRYDNRTKKEVLELIGDHREPIPRTPPAIARWLERLGEEGFRRQLRFRRAMDAALGGDHEIDEMERLLCDLLSKGICYRMDQLAVNGNDLMDAGIPPGKPVGDCLRTLLAHVMDGRVPNNRQALLAEAARLNPIEKEENP